MDVELGSCIKNSLVGMVYGSFGGVVASFALNGNNPITRLFCYTEVFGRTACNRIAEASYMGPENFLNWVGSGAVIGAGIYLVKEVLKNKENKNKSLEKTISP